MVQLLRHSALPHVNNANAITSVVRASRVVEDFQVGRPHQAVKLANRNPDADAPPGPYVFNAAVSIERGMYVVAIGGPESPRFTRVWTQQGGHLGCGTTDPDVPESCVRVPVRVFGVVFIECGEQPS